MKHYFVIVGLITGLLISCKGEATPLEEKAKPLDVANKWLALIDSGRYAQSWDQTSDQFKKITPKEKWIEGRTAADNQIGKLNNRTLREQVKQEKDKVLYLILKYKLNYEKKPYVAETLVLIKEENKDWMIAGYDKN